MHGTNQCCRQRFEDPVCFKDRLQVLPVIHCDRFTKECCSLEKSNVIEQTSSECSSAFGSVNNVKDQSVKYLEKTRINFIYKYMHGPFITPKLFNFYFENPNQLSLTYRVSRVNIPEGVQNEQKLDWF